MTQISPVSLAVMARVKSIGVHAKHDAKNTYVVSLTFEGGEQPTIKQFDALRAAAQGAGFAQCQQDKETVAQLVRRIRQYNAAHLAYELSHDEAVQAVCALRPNLTLSDTSTLCGGDK